MHTTTTPPSRRRHGTRLVCAAVALAAAAAIVPSAASAGTIGYYAPTPGQITKLDFLDYDPSTVNDVDITFTAQPSRIIFTDHTDPIDFSPYYDPNFPCSPQGAHTAVCQGSSVQEVRAWTGGGDDRVEMHGLKRLVAFAGAGNDTITGGDDRDELHGDVGQDTLRGGGRRDELHGDGDGDQLFGGADADHLLGGDGRDLLDGELGGDLLAGGPGRDLASYRQRTADVTILPTSDGDEVHATVAQLEQDTIDLEVEDFEGGSGDDFIRGTHGDNAIFGHEGRDHLTAQGGTDYVDGGSDPDLLFGGHGEDTLAGGFGADELTGGNGRDILDGGIGSDELRGGNQDDWFYARDLLADEISCGAGFGDEVVTADAIDTTSMCETLP